MVYVCDDEVGDDDDEVGDDDDEEALLILFRYPFQYSKQYRSMVD